MDFYVFDLDFNFHGIIDDYVNIPVTRNYEKKTSFTIEVAPTEQNLKLLKKNRLISKKTDIKHAYIIETVEFIDGRDSSLSATVFSLHHLLHKRAIIDQQTFYGRVGYVLSQFVNANAVNPINPKRQIPNLVINASNSNIGLTTSESRTSGQLDEVLFEIAKKQGVSWDILFDHDNKRFEFKVWQGADRSERQSNNPRVVFAKEFDNIISQNYIDSDNGFKNVAIVAGEGEGADRKRVIVNDELSGFERNELFVDARDLQSTYYDENNQEVTIPENEYLNILRERGKSKLSEHEPIENLDNVIDLESSFKYEEDFFLGDIVSVKNERLGLVAHPRIVQIVETYSKEGRTLHADFGKSIPTRDERLQKKIEESIIIGGNTGSKNIEWNNIKDKPSTYPPASHNHDDRYESKMNVKSGTINVQYSDGVYFDVFNRLDLGSGGTYLIEIGPIMSAYNGGSIWHESISAVIYMYGSETNNTAASSEVPISYSGHANNKRSFKARLMRTSRTGGGPIFQLCVIGESLTTPININWKAKKIL